MTGEPSRRGSPL